MTISYSLFFGLLIMAVLPAYLCAGYSIMSARRVADVMSKLLETQISGNRGIGFPTANQRIAYVDDDEYARIMGELVKKRKSATDEPPKQPTGGNLYI